MRTTWAVWLIFSLSLAALMFGASGLGGVIAGSAPGAGIDGGAAEDVVGNVSVEDGVGGSDTQTDDSFFGLVTDGAGSVSALFGLITLGPSIFSALGFPAWFATPAGVGLQLVAGIGLIQFTLDRVLR